jgi:hypothetical protein
VIFNGPRVDPEADVEVLGVDAADVSAPGGVEGPLAHAAVAAVNDTAVTANRRILMWHTVTLPIPSCLSALFSFYSGTLC